MHLHRARKFHPSIDAPFQKGTDLLIPRLPFSRLVRELARQRTFEEIRFSADALEALQEATEMYAVHIF